MANLKDVAKKAGVSIATVSRVINKTGNVDPATENIVNSVIKGLNYKPSTVAQRLRNQNNKSRLIGLILPDIQNPFYVDVIHGVEELVWKKGYAVVIGNFSQDKKKEQLYIDIFQSESIVGFIVAPVDGKDRKVKELIKSGNPVVCVDRGMDNDETDVVLMDNEKGAFTAVDHLVKLGHKKIALIAGSKDIPTTNQRIQGYKRALELHHIEVNNDYIVSKSSTRESGVELTDHLLKLPNPPSAIFTGNNLITLGALETIHKYGLKIPDDIALIGYDDMPWSYALNPPLTAVRQSGFEIGNHAAELLLQRIQNPDRAVAKLIMNTELMIRKSCGANKT